MNAKQCKKLRWMARVQETFMPPVEMKDGAPTSIRLYKHRKVGYQLVKKEGGPPEKREVEFFNYTIQWNPATSGRGTYRAFKAKLREVGIRKTDLPKQSIVYTRLMCQLRIKRGLDQRRAAERDAARPTNPGELPVADGAAAGADAVRSAGDVV